ncbi:MAG: hypothetical protein HYV63_12555 [Candidatus Schekmanbacteria bacterium]|nr:hypothetical protein [Candidatus Schekmanbacteria bacterium]
MVIRPFIFVSAARHARWQFKALAVFLAAAAAIAVIWHRQPPALVAAAPIQARLELAAGRVLVTGAAGEQRVSSGAALFPGDHVAATVGSRALVRLADGAGVFLNGGSTLTLRHDAVEIDEGQAWLDIPAIDREPLTYRLGATALSASDAGISVQRTAETTDVYVARGLAVVTAAGGRVEVHAGERAAVSGSNAPAVSPVAFWDDWTGGMADRPTASAASAAGAGTIYGIDLTAPPGTPALPLTLSRQAVHATIRSGLAETEVDQTFYNPGTQPIEGWYWFSVPEGAAVTSFAVEFGGEMIPAQLVEREAAATGYARGVARGDAPALLEWIDGTTFRARIYPIAPAASRRVVLRYMELLHLADGRIRYLYPMRSPLPAKIGELSLTVDLGPEADQMTLATLAEARLEQGGRLVSMRRSGFTPQADFLLEATYKTPPPAIRVARAASGSDTADYVMVRYTPDMSWEAATAPGLTVAVVVDTSAGGSTPARQQRTALAEAILRSLSAQDRFCLVALDVEATVLHPAAGVAAATDEEISRALEALTDHGNGGATDLTALFGEALGRIHGGEQAAVVYLGDGVPTSGELRGDQLVERLRRAVAASVARFYTVGVGTEVNQPLLEALARAGGGRAYALSSGEDATDVALRLSAAMKTPALTDFALDAGAGLDEVFLSAAGKVSQGDEVVLLARSHHPIPDAVRVTGKIAGAPVDRSYAVHYESQELGPFVARLWAREQLRALLATEDLRSTRGHIVKLGLEYGLMTPFTSLLAVPGAPRRAGARPGSQASDVRLGQAQEPRRNSAVSAKSKSEGMFSDLIQELAAPAEKRAAEAPMPATAPVRTEALHQLAADEPMPQDAEEAATQMAPASLASGRADDKDAIGAKKVEAGRELGYITAAGTASSAADVVRERRQETRAQASLLPCSDASQRPLLERVRLWRSRLGWSPTGRDLIAAYEAARDHCELSDWSAESAFLRLIERRIDDAAVAASLLTYFGNNPTALRYLAGRLARHAVDDELMSIVDRAVAGKVVDWTQLDADLAREPDAEKRVARLRAVVEAAPDSPEGAYRLIRALAAAGRADEALLLGRRLEGDGLLTPRVARALGDVLAGKNETRNAIRTYSEIVEFDPDSAESRRLLGDTLLAHGWYDAAYRQYAALADPASGAGTGVAVNSGRTGAAAQDALRLAAAAAGAGRVDEALRIERGVALAPGSPGPEDPRRWARLASAARLAAMIAAPATGGGRPAAPAEANKRLQEQLERKLKELDVFRGPSTVVIVTWENLFAGLRLDPAQADGGGSVGETVDAPQVGLAAAFLPAGSAAATAVTAERLPGAEQGQVPVRVHRIQWDGSRFSIRVEEQALGADRVRVGERLS